MNDPVNHPSHYKTFPDTEAIQIIKASLTPEEYIGYLKGSFLKYRLRAGDKGPAQVDIDKSNWYRTELRAVTAELDALLAKVRAGSSDYCNSEKYDLHKDLLHDDSWRDASAPDFGPPECDHPSWHEYQSMHERVCTVCGRKESTKKQSKTNQTEIIANRKNQSGC